MNEMNETRFDEIPKRVEIADDMQHQQMDRFAPFTLRWQNATESNFGSRRFPRETVDCKILPLVTFQMEGVFEQFGRFAVLFLATWNDGQTQEIDVVA